MRLYVLFFLVFFLTTISFAQGAADYFQQETNYTIDVELNDSLHTLEGTVDIEYKNNAPQALNEIYLHLWANAYKTKTSEFTKQKLEQGNRDFYFAPPSDMGGFEGISIRINGKVATWNYWKKSKEIVKIELTKPLASGETLLINTDFKLQIPASYSRLGRVGQSYQMTQWFPKPAVFDKDGWHLMPYLDQGEFYSEFGSFDVKITLPKNYVVGATGVLQTPSEKEFIDQRIQDTKDGKDDTWKTPVTSSIETKTIQYKAKKVHDFAWFADKQFYVEKSEATLTNGKKIPTYAMYTSIDYDYWKGKAVEYVTDALEFYSAKVGDYPYPQATAVQSALSAGAGMEYPMITVIGKSSSNKSLDRVIAHEVGHNWFYGILATNERSHAWLDEGFNSYYEKRYMSSKYAKKETDGVLGVDVEKMGIDLVSCRHSCQVTDTDGRDFRKMNYGLESYLKPAYLLSFIEDYLGKNELDRIMNVYYDTWKFKHPQPSDVKALFEKESGKDMSWLFDDLFKTLKTVDYAVKSVEKQEDKYLLTIENRGGVAAPVSVDYLINKEWKTYKIFDGFQGTKTFEIKVDKADKFQIFNNSKVFEKNLSNNVITSKGGKFEPLSLKFLAGKPRADKTTMYYLPLLGGNAYDGFMLGASFYNSMLRPKSFEWSISPMYGFKSKDITGFAQAKYRWYPKSLQEVALGVDLQRFSYNYNKDFYKQFENTRYNFTYNRINTTLDIVLKNKRPSSYKKQRISLEFIAMNQAQAGAITRDTIQQGTDSTNIVLKYAGHRNTWNFVPRIKYHLSNEKGLTPYEVNAMLEQYSYKNGGGYIKLNIEGKAKFFYEKNKAFYVRLFAGTFLQNSKGELLSRALGAYSIGRQATADYWADDLHLGRNETDGFLANEILPEREGGFKIPATNNSFGFSNKGIVAMNAKVDLPLPITGLKPYFDLAYLSTKNSTTDNSLYLQAGLAYEIRDFLGIYVPLVSSKNIQSQLKQKGKFFSRITFSVNYKLFNPRKQIRKIEL